MGFFECWIILWKEKNRLIKCCDLNSTKSSIHPKKSYWPRSIDCQKNCSLILVCIVLMKSPETLNWDVCFCPHFPLTSTPLWQKNAVIYNFPAICLAAAGVQLVNLTLQVASPLLQLAVLLPELFVLRFFWEQNKNLDNVSACKGLSETGGACSKTSCSFISPTQASSKLGKVLSTQDPGGSALSHVALSAQSRLLLPMQSLCTRKGLLASL